MTKAFEVKQETFFLVSHVLSFRLIKQTSKNVADTTFKQYNTLEKFITDTETYLEPSQISMMLLFSMA